MVSSMEGLEKIIDNRSSQIQMIDDSTTEESLFSFVMDESNMETVMEDSAVEYVLVAPEPPPLDSWNFPLSPSGGEIEDFVVISHDDFDDLSSSWWNSLQKYANIAAQKGGEWTTFIASCKIPAVSFFRTGRSTIHDCYDWVSDTNIEGGRLILPGQLIAWDDPPELKNEGNSKTLKTNTRAVGEFSSSNIMVSAHDLLSCQSHHHDEVYIGFPNTTLSFSAALMRVSRLRARNVANTTGNLVLVSTLTFSQRVATAVSKCETHTGLVSKTVGWIYQSMEWCFPSSPIGKSSGRHSGIDGVTIELSAVEESVRSTDTTISSTNPD